MQAVIAMALVHPLSREAIDFAARSIHGDHPNWQRDPDLRSMLWDFATSVAEYSATQRLSLETRPIPRGTLGTLVCSQLPNIEEMVDEAVDTVHRTFGDLGGMNGTAAHYCLMRIGLFVPFVLHAQAQGHNPSRLLS